MMKAVFLDRDGTITAGIPYYERVKSLDMVRLLPNTLAALELLAAMDYGVFIVTNQSGIAEGLITMEQFEQMNDKVLRLIAPSGIQVLKTYLCPHGEGAACDCRKPRPKLLHDATREFGVDLAASWMIGDRPSDVQTAVNAGARGILVLTGSPDAVAPEAVFTAPSLLEAVRFIHERQEM